MFIVRIVAIVLFFGFSIQLNAEETSKQSIEEKTKQEPIRKEFQFQHIIPLQNGNSLIGDKKSLKKSKNPEVWHPKIKGLE